jgi:hypothetical protein
MAAMHDGVGAIERGMEEALIRFDMQLRRLITIGVRDHAVSGDDGVAFDAAAHAGFLTCR